MSDSDSDLLKRLQQDFLSDKDGNFEVFFESLALFRKDLKEGIRGIWIAAHNLKGTAQAVGFIPFAEFINEFESSLNIAQTQVINTSELEEQVLIHFENCCASCIKALENYFNDLKANALDSLQLKSKYIPQILQLRNFSIDLQKVDWGMDDSFETDSDNADFESSKNKKADASAAFLKIEEKPSVEFDKVKLYILMKYHQENYALLMENVVEVFDCRGWTNLPLPIKGILGVMNRYGEVLTILDFCQLIGLEPFKSSDINQRSIVVCSIDGHKFGFPIDSVTKIVSIANSKLQASTLLDYHRNLGIITYLTLLEEETINIVSLEKMRL